MSLFHTNQRPTGQNQQQLLLAKNKTKAQLWARNDLMNNKSQFTALRREKIQFLTREENMVSNNLTFVFFRLYLMRPPMVYIVWLNGKGWSRNFTSFYPSHGMFRVASQAEAKWLLYKIQQGRTFSSMPKPIGWAAGRHLGPGLNSLKDVVNQDLPFIFLRCLSIWAAATTKCTKILGN